MRKELTTFCDGINNTVWCKKIGEFLVGEEIVELARKKLPEQYQKWEVERAGLDIKTMKIYTQIRFQGLIRTVVL